MADGFVSYCALTQDIRDEVAENGLTPEYLALVLGEIAYRADSTKLACIRARYTKLAAELRGMGRAV